jgi:hypothetical protein
MTGQIPSNEASEQLDRARIRYGFWLILFSLVLISGLFLLVADDVPMDEPGDVPAVLGSLTTLYGVLVGFFFGHAAGSSGKERAEASRERSDAVAKAALAHIDPAKRKQVMEMRKAFLGWRHCNEKPDDFAFAYFSSIIGTAFHGSEPLRPHHRGYHHLPGCPLKLVAFCGNLSPFLRVEPIRAMARHMVERLTESPVMTSMYSQRSWRVR